MSAATPRASKGVSIHTTGIRATGSTAAVKRVPLIRPLTRHQNNASPAR